MSSFTSAKPGATADLLAGITAAAVVLPKAMAYATVAGLPVAIGLYTAFVPMVLYALLGSSRVLSVSSTSTLAILTATQLGIVVPDGDPDRLLTVTATLTMLVGILLMLAAVLRLGFVANFISLPVLVGFKGGIGLVIILDQLPKLFGVHIHKENFFCRYLPSVAGLAPDLMVDAGHRPGDVGAAGVHGVAFPALTRALAGGCHRYRAGMGVGLERAGGVDCRHYSHRPASIAIA